VLISVNPYRRIEGLYDDNIAEEVYVIGTDLAERRAKTTATVPDPRTPHVFVVADRAYTTMCEGTSR